MSLKTKTGRIVSMKMVNALHTVFILAKTMNRVKPIVLSNSNWKMMTVLVRFIMFKQFDTSAANVVSHFSSANKDTEIRTALHFPYRPDRQRKVLLEKCEKMRLVIGKRQFCQPILRS